MALAFAIKIGPEWHAVEDEVTGELLEEIAATEQCTECGGSRFHKVTDATGTVYACSAQCGQLYSVTMISDAVCVWQ